MFTSICYSVKNLEIGLNSLNSFLNFSRKNQFVDWLGFRGWDPSDGFWDYFKARNSMGHSSIPTGAHISNKHLCSVIRSWLHRKCRRFAFFFFRCSIVKELFFYIVKPNKLYEMLSSSGWLQNVWLNVVCCCSWKKFLVPWVALYNILFYYLL